jgi:hypothetical protein
MVLRSMPASRRRKLSVPSTSSSGSPAEKPSASMRRLAGSTRAGFAARGCARRGSGEGVGRCLTWGRAVFVYYSCMCLFCPSPSVAPSSPWSARRAFLLAAGAAPPRPCWRRWRWVRHRACASWCPPKRWNSAAQQYQQMLQQARAQRALAPAGHPQLQRLHAIAKRLIPFTAPWNDRARQWRWEVNLIGSSADQRLLHARRQDCVLHRHP